MMPTRLIHQCLAITAVASAVACAGPTADGSAQNAESASEEASTSTMREVPAGTELTFVVDEALSTGTHEVGREFSLHVASPVLATDGTQMIAAGAGAIGTIIESRSSNGSEDAALLAVRIETVQLNGGMVPVSGTVVNADIAASADASDAETAAKIAIGAAAGAIIGQVLGKNTEATVIGAGAGAVAGTVVALTTRHGEAVLPRGATVSVRLDEPLSEVSH